MGEILLGVVNYKTAELTRECVESVRRAIGESVPAIVVDNSNDFCPEGDSQVVTTGDNVGYAGGVNLLLREFLETDMNWLWILNPDCQVQPWAGPVLLKALSSNQGRWDIVTSRIEHGQSGLLWYAGGTFSRRTGRARHLGFGLPLNAALESDTPMSWASGAHLLISREFAQRAGNLDENLFLYSEELEWQIRNDAKVLVLDSPLVQHTQGASTKEVSSTLETFFMARNRILLRRSLAIPVVFLAAAWVVDFLVKPIMRGDTLRARAGWRALRAVRFSGKAALQYHLDNTCA